MSWQDELRLELEMWRGTPYMHGASCRGRGADCVGFVDGVMQRLRGLRLPDLVRRVSSRQVSHRPWASIAAMLELARRHPSDRLPGSTDAEPGDVLVYRVGGPETPGHVLIVGVPQVVAWHAPGPVGTRVGPTSVQSVAHEVLSVWRPRGKEQWQCPRY